jgi:p-aminobenzoyl-glutamate transporter AbgT
MLDVVERAGNRAPHSRDALPGVRAIVTSSRSVALGTAFVLLWYVAGIPLGPGAPV